MASSIRGHMGTFKLFENGAPTKIVDITKVSISQDSTFSRTMYVGRPVPEGDQSIDGWTGSCDLEVKDSSVDDFIDALVTNNLNGVGISDYTFISTENYADGSSSSYVYADVQWKMSKENGGLNDKITKKLDFQCSQRLKL